MSAPDHTPRAVPTCDCGYPALGHRPKHTPLAWPICSCGARSSRHRVKHRPYGTGELCDCGISRPNHMIESGYTYDYVGIDGEGIGRKPHKYILLTAADENGKTWSHENLDGIRSLDALQFVVDSLSGARVFAYGFGYDTTCMLKDLPNGLLFRLLRPSLRYDRGRLRPIKWNGFKIDWLQGRLTIEQKDRRVVIWDLVKFFQCTFIKALENWGIPTLNIEHMKQKRGRFRSSELPAIRSYCRDECIQLAKLARKLLETHRNVDLTLRTYYGPGSTASVAIGKMKAIEHRGHIPDIMVRPVACGFFGGRFEHSVMGPVPEVYGYDISSAYPYQLYQLPCLDCGEWEHVSLQNAGRRTLPQSLLDCTTAICRYEYTGNEGDTFAPFPHRSASGSICYPYRGRGWLWLPEIQAAFDTRWRMGWSRVRLLEAWVYKTKCKHRPFADIATYYRRRYELGKDAAGIVLKLAANSVYGKLAQSKGVNPKFQCWPWAGLITSGTRAQILRLVALAPKPSDILAIATDGVYSRVKLDCPKPIDTGTFDLSKPLGGWEEKHYPDGMLFVKPGIYCSLSPEGDVRARGIGRKSLTSARQELIETWNKGERSFTITVDRFYGAKTCIGPKLKRSLRYGQWERMPIRIAFTCPNRSESMGLLAQTEESVPYSPVHMTPEKKEAILFEAIEYEQP